MPDDAVPADLPEILALGTAPRPTDGAALSALLRTAIVDHLPAEVEDGERVQVRATVDPPHVPTLEVDLTGLVVRVSFSEPELAGPAQPVDEVPTALSSSTARRTDAVLRRARVEAHPLSYASVPVDVVLECEDVAFRWVEGLDGSLGVEPVEPGDDTPLRGSVQVSAPKDNVLEATRRALQEPLEELGRISLTAFDVELESAGPRSVRVVGFARARKGILSASVRAHASIDVDARMVLTVRELRLTSRNPAVAVALLVARKQIAQVRGRTIDLTDELPAGLRLADVRLDVGDTVTAWARFA